MFSVKVGLGLEGILLIQVIQFMVKREFFLLLTSLEEDKIVVIGPLETIFGILVAKVEILSSPEIALQK